jgi:WD40 repeat protein
MGGLAFADNERVVAWGWAWPLKVALVWEAPNGKPLTPATGHLGMIAGVRFTADGKGVITAGMDRRVLRWEVPTEQPEGSAVTGRPKVVGARLPRSRSWNTHLGPDGTRALEESLVYDPATGEELFAIPGESAFVSTDFRRAVGFPYPRNVSADTTWCEVWDLEKRARLARLTPPATNVAFGSTAAFSPDNSRLVTTTLLNDPKASDRTPLLVCGWDGTTGKKLGEVRDSVPVLRLRLDDNSTHIAVGDNSRVVLATLDGKLWVADYARGVRGETIAELTRPRQRFTVPTFSPDGKTLAVGMPVGAGLEYGVGVYDWPGGKRLHTFTGHAGVVTALSFSADGKALASGSTDGTVLVWDMAAVGRK